MIVGLAIVLASVACFVLGWNTRGRSMSDRVAGATDSLDAAKALGEMTSGFSSKVLEAAGVISKTDARLESMERTTADMLRVTESLDRNQASILNILVNSPAFHGEHFDTGQIGERPKVPKDEPPPSLEELRRRAESDLRIPTDGEMVMR